MSLSKIVYSKQKHARAITITEICNWNYIGPQTQNVFKTIHYGTNYEFYDIAFLVGVLQCLIFLVKHIYF